MNTSHRSIIALRSPFLDFVARFHHPFSSVDVLWVSDTSTNLIKHTPYKQALNKLGQETDIVVFDANQALAVNALGAISGCIRGGGTLIVLIPLDNAHHHESLFFQRLLQVFSAHNIPIHTLENCPDVSVQTPRQNPELTANSKICSATSDQRLVIQATKKVVTGHRNRPLVVTSDRGRGKSSALGMAVNELLLERPIQIIISAPAKAMVTPLLAYAGQHDNLHYIAPDKLVRELPEAGLVIIDEAGAIPVPLLSQLLQHYSRLVFATTLHGYEGNGRGFAVRFHSLLKQFTPDWRSIELTQPIRWRKNDPLETLINDLLLLDAEPAKFEQLEQIPKKSLKSIAYKNICRTELIKDESLLRQLFGLLVIAHYQTRPSDLLQILDSQQLSIKSLFFNDKLVAVAIISHEGGLNVDLAAAIYRGERRPKGDLVPQILLSQMGMLEAATLKTDRIMRIATHPLWRRQQLASSLLKNIASHSTADYLSTSFGLSESLLKFWENSEFTPVYLGLKREASSGYHSAVLLRALNQSGAALQQAAIQSFSTTLLAQLGDTLSNYDPKLAFQLLSGSQQHNMSLYPQEIRDIKRFIGGQCGLDSALAALQRWLPSALSNNKQIIRNDDAKLLIMRILQHHNWPHCGEVLGITSKKIAQQTLQKIISTLAAQQADGNVSTDGLRQLKRIASD